MAYTLRDVAREYLRTQDVDGIIDLLLLTKAQQLTVIKAYAATLRDQIQNDLNQNSAKVAAQTQNVSDLNTIATS